MNPPRPTSVPISVPPGFRDVAIATINATSTNPREFSAPCNFEKSLQLFCNFDESSRRGLLQSVVIRQQTHLFCSEDAADVDCQRLTFRLPTKITEKANVANLVFVAIFSDIKKRLETNLAAFWTNLSNQMLPAQSCEREVCFLPAVTPLSASLFSERLQ